MDRVKCANCGLVNRAGLSACEQCGAPILVVSTDLETPVEVPAAGSQRTPVHNFRAGQILANRYVIQELIGQGGMGCIYKVHDNTLNEVAALKMLLPEYVRDKVIVERFFNEARIARGLSHPNIGRVHDIGMADDIIYISMEYITGRSLRAMLDDLKPGQRLSLNLILRIFGDLCTALDYAHQFTIHRDIKPENVMIDGSGRVKLMDFGISKLKTRTNLTSTSMIMGTPHYMSPEQLRNSSSVDARADIYSVGVMLYEMLVGYTPTGIIRHPSEITQNVPPALDPIIEKCLAHDPDERYESAGELATALRRAGTVIQSSAGRRPDDPRTAAARPVPWASLARASLLALIAMGTVLGLVRAEQLRASADTAGQEAHGPRQSADSARSAPKPEIAFSDMVPLVEMGKLRVERGLREATDLETIQRTEGLLGKGNSWWDAARAEHRRGDPAAAESAWKALYYYVAAVFRPEGMVFVPPGRVTVGAAGSGDTAVYVDAFYISQKEVTVGDFWNFADEDSGPGWRWPPDLENDSLELPMTQATFYDAQGYAASQSPPKKVPTEAQWVRAFRVAMRDRRLLSLKGGLVVAKPATDGLEALDSDDAAAMAQPGLKSMQTHENYSEWTRSIWKREAHAGDKTREEQWRIGFGTQLATRSCVLDEPDVFRLIQSDPMPFEGVDPYLGFRCVYEFSRDLEKIRDLLSK